MIFLANLTLLIEVNGYMLICSQKHYADEPLQPINVFNQI